MPLEKEKEHAFARLAYAALKANDGDVEKSKAYLDRRLQAEADLRRTVIAQILDYAIGQRVQQAMRDKRRTLVHAVTTASVNQDYGAQRERYLSLAEPIRESLMDFTLRGGLKLRHANRDTITQQTDFYEKQSNTMAQTARWLRLVLQGLPENKVVEHVYTESRLAELWRESAKLIKENGK